MNKRWKTKWLKALRSDEYVQGHRRLVTLAKGWDEFCCLGVLCDALGEEFTLDPYGNNRLGVDRNGEGIEYLGLPRRLKRKTGLSSIKEGLLMKMNDGQDATLSEAGVQKHSFSEIADYIEKNL